MKRVLTIILSFSFFCVSVYAQKPASGSFLPEAEFNISSLDRDGNFSFSNFELPTLRGRYFIQNDLVFRVDLSVQNSNSTTNFFENADGTGSTGTVINKNGGIGFGLGIEKHLNGANKLSPFVGFGVSYTMFSNILELTNVNGGSYQMDYASTTEQKGSAIGANVLLGADYWVNNSFYLGTQINIGVLSQKVNDGTTEITTGGSTTKSVAAGGKGFLYAENIIPSFRIGFLIPSNGGAEGDADNDGIADSKDKCPGTPKGMAVDNDGCPAIVKEVSMLAKNIYFETGGDVIKSESLKSLDRIALIMNNNKLAKLRIEGHTDNVGDDAMNLDLSKRRAAAVVKYLTSKNVDASRLSSEGYGETRPIADNAIKDGQALNRRVEMILMF